MRLILGLIIKGPPFFKGTSIFPIENKNLVVESVTKGNFGATTFYTFQETPSRSCC